MEIKKMEGLEINKDIKPLKMTKEVIEKLLRLKEQALQVKSGAWGDYRKSPTVVMLGCNENKVITKVVVLLRAKDVSNDVASGCYHRPQISSDVLSKGIVALVKVKATPIALLKIMSFKNPYEMIQKRNGPFVNSNERELGSAGDGGYYYDSFRDRRLLNHLVIQEQQDITYMFCETIKDGDIHYTDWEVV